MILNILKSPAFRRACYTLLERYRPSNTYSVATLTNDYITKEILSSGWYEKPFLSLLGMLIKTTDNDEPPSYVVDVGANIGNHSLYFSQISDQVISIEPNPICVNLMKASLGINNLNNITIVAKGAGAKISRETLSFAEHHTGGGSFLTPEADASLRNIEINVDTLDNITGSLIPGNANLKLVKIDAEGFEVNVLKGSKAMLSAHSPIIAFEAHGIVNFTKIRDALVSEGYVSFYKLTQARRMSSSFFLNAVNMLFRPSTLSIDKIIDPEDTNYQMVIAVKEDSYERLDRLNGVFSG